MALKSEKVTETALPWLATLSRGSTYWLRDLVFEKGVPVPVTDEQREHLEEHAAEDRLKYIDPDDDTANIERIQYFAFEPNPAFIEGAAS